MNKLNVPKGWRQGQMVFNFLQWLGENKKAPRINTERLSDPFHLSDEEWAAYYQEFLKICS